MSISTVAVPPELNLNRKQEEEDRIEILLMSSSLLTDRMFLHTRFISELQNEAHVTIWATSLQNPRFRDLWSECPARVEPFPEVNAYKEFPYTHLRRLNEFVWDFRQRPPGRLSAMRHIRNKEHKSYIRALKLPARALAAMKLEEVLENRVESVLLDYPRSRQALDRLRGAPPDLILSTGPFQFEQPAVVAVAKKLGIPTLALIPSWDNLSTKGRMVFKYDGYIVWSEQTKRELHEAYPYTREAPVYVVGAPQFDAFFDDRFSQTREQFFLSEGLRPELPLIVYALGSPKLLREHHGALYLAERVSRGDLGDVQMLVRPHPIHEYNQLTTAFERFSDRVILQQTAEPGTILNARSQDKEHIVQWVNTFRHADVVVNLSSTVTVDAAIFDRPVVNLDFDPEPGQAAQALVKDINHLWPHFKPIAESGGVWLAQDPEEVFTAVTTYLKNPTLHRKKRRWIAQYVCGYLDGRCGDRMGQALLAFIRHHSKRTVSA
jgi:CDP-Glycerol:Poly(glycerophosphate) glycerophosphotransferase